MKQHEFSKGGPIIELNGGKAKTKQNKIKFFFFFYITGMRFFSLNFHFFKQSSTASE
jgi:hypothetical protein